MNKLIKSISFIPVFKPLISWLYSKYAADKKLATYWINRYISNKNLTLVQIGSNDGMTGDPLHNLIKKNYNWKVLFVEPVPYLFEKLKNNYKEDFRFSFSNTAINEGIDQPFYWVRKDAQQIANLPEYYDQLGSFNKENITKHLDGILSPFIEEMIVKGITLNELLKTNEVNNLSVLHIDTEGYDWKILSQLDLNVYKPNIILFEVKHLSTVEKNEAIFFLKNQYFIYKFNADFLCIKRSIIRKKDLKFLNTRNVIFS